jgi:hypothetical protein
VRGDLRRDFGHAYERPVPARFEFPRHLPVRGIGSIKLAERPISRITRRFEIAQQSIADLVTSARCFGGGGRRSSERSGLHNAQQSLLNSVVDA